jgi:hypothetical protein
MKAKCQREAYEIMAKCENKALQNEMTQWKAKAAENVENHGEENMKIIYSANIESMENGYQYQRMINQWNVGIKSIAILMLSRSWNIGASMSMKSAAVMLIEEMAAEKCSESRYQNLR